MRILLTSGRAPASLELARLLNLSGNEVIYDLYCGTGSISLYLASQSKMVYGLNIKSNYQNQKLALSKHFEVSTK